MFIYNSPEITERLLSLPKYEAALCHKSEMKRYKYRLFRHSVAHPPYYIDTFQISRYLCNTRNYWVLSDFKMSRQQVILVSDGKSGVDLFTNVFNQSYKNFVFNNFRSHTNIGRKPVKIKLGSMMLVNFKGKDRD